MLNARQRRRFRAALLFKGGKVEEALRVYHALLARAPEDCRTLEDLARAYVKLRRLPEASAVLRQLAALHAQDEFLLKAVGELKLALRLDPSGAGTGYVQIAKWLREMGPNPEADWWLVRAVGALKQEGEDELARQALAGIKDAPKIA